jgi:hypothetical protein
MHDMAMDLMRRAEDIEQDLRNAKEKMAEQMRAPKDQPQRERPEARSKSVEVQLEQLRNENRELRMMVERIAQELRKDRD